MTKPRSQSRPATVAADDKPPAPQPAPPAEKAEAPKVAAQQKPSRRAEESGQDSGGGIHETHAMGVFVDSSFHSEFPEDWAPPAQLEAPKPQPGMVQRWVRVSILGQNDGNNVALQSGQGWRPRRLDSVPSGEQSRFPSVSSKRWGDVIVSGALILCEMPQAIYAKMENYYKEKRIGLIETIRNDSALRQAVKAPKQGGGFGEMYAEERSTQVSHRRPTVAAD